MIKKILTTLSFFMIIFASNLEAHNLQESIKSDHRLTSNTIRDDSRHPYETLSFFEIKPEMTVVELSPGGGWYTEILAMYMYDEGRLITAPYNPALGDYAQRSFKNFVKKLKSDEVYKKVEIIYLFEKLAEDATVDAVLTFRNVHNWLDNNAKGAKKIFQQAYSALKPGGIFGVVEHRASPGTSLVDMYNSGYVTEKYIINLANQVGFILSDKSEINSNWKDKKDYSKGVWTLPPTYRLKDIDREIYEEIGESDRMTLLFRKPL